MTGIVGLHHVQVAAPPGCEDAARASTAGCSDCPRSRSRRSSRAAEDAGSERETVSCMSASRIRSRRPRKRIQRCSVGSERCARGACTGSAAAGVEFAGPTRPRSRGSAASTSAIRGATGSRSSQRRSPSRSGAAGRPSGERSGFRDERPAPDARSDTQMAQLDVAGDPAATVPSGRRECPPGGGCRGRSWRGWWGGHRAGVRRSTAAGPRPRRRASDRGIACARVEGLCSRTQDAGTHRPPSSGRHDAGSLTECPAAS